MKSNYKFNPETLAYEQVKLSFKQRLSTVFGFFTISLIIAFFLTIIITTYFQTPKSIKLYQDNLEIISELDKIKNELLVQNGEIAELIHRNNIVYRAVFEADTIKPSYKNPLDNYTTIFRDNFFSTPLINLNTVLDNQSVALYDLALYQSSVELMSLGKGNMVLHIPSIRPVSKALIPRPVSLFGYRTDPIFKIRRMHKGVDFAGRSGIEIYATGNGVIEFSGNRFDGYGIQVVINHGYGYKTRYAHCSRVFYKYGDNVKKGATIGLIGSTGKSTGAHLHYEVLYRGIQVDPLNYIYDVSEEDYKQIINDAKAMPLGEEN